MKNELKLFSKRKRKSIDLRLLSYMESVPLFRDNVENNKISIHKNTYLVTFDRNPLSNFSYNIFDDILLAIDSGAPVRGSDKPIHQVRFINFFLDSDALRDTLLVANGLSGNPLIRSMYITRVDKSNHAGYGLRYNHPLTSTQYLDGIR